MWYEVLPFLGIMVGCTVAANYIHIPFNYFKTGGYLRNNKDTHHRQDAAIQGRDVYLTGSIHKQLGNVLSDKLINNIVYEIICPTPLIHVEKLAVTCGEHGLEAVPDEN